MKKTRPLAKAILLSLFLTVFTLDISAQKVTLSFQNESFEKVLNSIKKQTGLSLVFSEQLVDLNRKVSIKANSIEVNDALKQLLAGTNLGYEIKNNKLYLIEKKGTEPKSEPKQSKKNITGLVTDEKGEPIIGASIVIKGVNAGTITNVDGRFSIEVLEQQVLLVSFIGYKQAIIKIGQLSNLKIVLEEDNKALDEIVVVGYGTQKKETLTGSVSSIKSDQLGKINVANTTNALAGQLPGLISLQQNGMPGADAAILSIRGFGNALVIVDGIEADISTLDPNSIESVSILKDGAASIYGARAGNGVILLTTKRGSNTKPLITLNTSYTLQGITRMPEKASSGQYAEMKSEQAINQGLEVPFTPEQIQNFYNASDPYLYPNTDWKSILIRDWAPQQQHNLSLSGGSERIKYYGFLGYLNQQSMFKTNGGDFSRIHLQSNIDAKVTDRLSMQVDFSSINEIRKFPIVSQFSSMEEGGSIWQHYWADLAIYPAEFPDPTKYAYTGNDGMSQILTNRERIGFSDAIKNDLRATISLKYDFKHLKGLYAKAFVNARQVYNEGKYMMKPNSFYTYDPTSDTYTLVGGYVEKATMTQTRNTDRVFTGQFSLNYDKTIHTDHHVSSLLLYEAIDYSGNFLTAGRQNFLTPAIEELFGGSTEGMTNSGSAYEMGRKSIVARANYNYKSKYLIETSIRADASAKFPNEKRWGYFPSLSLGWNIREEGFMQTIDLLDQLKLRASYGKSGNDAVGNFQYLSGYVYGSTQLFSTVGQGIVSTGLANPNLTWEEVAISNIGTDFSFWNRRLYGEADVFYRSRTGLIANRLLTLPTTFGASLPPENINSTNDRGFEFKIGTSERNKDFKYDVSANVSFSRAKWDHFEEPVYEDPEQARIFTKSGRWTDIIYGYVSEGLFESQEEISALTYDQDGKGNATLRPGDIRYKDLNEDGKIDWTDQIQIGNGNSPHWMYGFNFYLYYKNFDISGILQGAAGYHTWVSFIFNSKEFYDNRWTEENNNPNALIPRLGGSATNNWTTDHFYKTSAYLRLKSLNIGYSLPKAWLKAVNLQQFRIFVSGTNLLTFDKLREYGMDPEAPSGAAGLYYPQQRLITFGINLTL